MPVSFSIADSSEGPRKVVIWVTGDLDADTARAVRARLAQAQRHSRSDVIIDMTGVSFVDSVGLTAIVNGAKALGDGGQLRVISPPDRVAEILRDAGLGKVFQLEIDKREKRDRRRQDVPVELDRRRGGDRRFQSQSGDTPADGLPKPPVKNGV
jgi:anti-sigma B factor antagonist